VNGQSHHDEARQRYLLMWAANPAEGSQAAIGPATVIRAIGPSLRLGPRGQEVAHFRNGLWLRRKIGGRFSLLWTETFTTVRFEDPLTGNSLAVGPFDMVGFVCDTIYTDRENSRPAACLDESSGRWRSSVDGALWPEVVLMPAPRPALAFDDLYALGLNGNAVCA
jgi:hypothetical protein